MFGLPVTFEEIIYAALLALCITWFIKNMMVISRIIKASKKTIHSPQDIATAMERCYSLFPLDHIEYHGTIFTRGMKIKITTTANANFEGEFIGGNSQNMVCIKTSKYIVAHKLSNIANMIKM